MSYQFGHVDRDERIDYGEEPEYEEPAPYRPPISGILLAGALMAVFAGGLWFAYHEGTKHGIAAAEPTSVPLLRAGDDPVKVKPDKVGGMDVPDKDNPLYVRKAGGAPVERLLPPAEQPQPRPAAPPPPPMDAQASAAPPPGPVSAQHQEAGPKAPVKPTPSPTGGTRIQLASVRTPEAARDEWTRLKRDNPELLGKLTANAVRADLGERGIYYRVEAGPVADKAAADRLCKALRERGLGCSLVK